MKIKELKKYIDENLYDFELLMENSNDDILTLKQKIYVKHKKCHCCFLETVSQLENQKCPSCCKKNNNKKTTEGFIKDVFKKYGSEYEILGKYFISSEPILIKHNKCGNKFYQTPKYFLCMGKCPFCLKSRNKTTEDFIKDVSKIYGTEYKVLGNYVNYDEPILVKHNKCGNKFNVKPKYFLKEFNKCKNCSSSMSNGELFISNFVKTLNVPFISQFNLVRNPKTNCWLKSDFAILNKEKEPILIIEYDGEQHFKSVDYFGGEEAFQATQYRDSVKDEYCKVNNIPFVRFSYTKNKMEIKSELLEKLKEVGYFYV
jgi:Protein of unknown function (DUF2726).